MLNYVVALDVEGRRWKVLHLNIVKAWNDWDIIALSVFNLPAEGEIDPLVDLLALAEGTSSFEVAQINQQLSASKKSQLGDAFGPCLDVFTEKPRRTPLAVYHVDTDIRQSAYKVSFADIQREIEEML